MTLTESLTAPFVFYLQAAIILSMIPVCFASKLNHSSYKLLRNLWPVCIGFALGCALLLLTIGLLYTEA